MADLNDDVLLNILHFCDINSILCFGQTTRRFHELSLSREVWFDHILSLYERGFIDLYPGQTPDQLSRDDLISLAQRCNRGPSSWKKGTQPQVSLRYSIKLDDPFGAASGADHRREAILVSGGQYLVFRHLNGQRLECWSLAPKRMIWTYEPRRQDFSVAGMAIDLVNTEDGPVIDILIGLRCLIDVWLPRKNLLEYIRLDPRTQIEETIFMTEVVDTPHDEPFGTLLLSGKYALAYVGTEIMLYDRTTRVLTRHNLPSNRNFPQHQIGLTRDHLVVMTRDPFWSTFTIKLHALQLMQKQASKSTTRVDIGRYSEVYQTNVNFLPEDLKARDQRELMQEGAIFHEISCHASPFNENDWCIWILMSAPYLRPSYGRIQKYRLRYSDDHDVDTPPVLKQLLSIGPIERAHRLPMRTKGISWAGFVQENYQDENHLYSLAEIGQPKFDLQLSGRGVHVNMSPYSGTITYTTASEIVVNHYH